MNKNKQPHIIAPDDGWPLQSYDMDSRVSLSKLVAAQISAPQACNQEAVIASVPLYENSPAIASPSLAGNEALNSDLAQAKSKKKH